MIFSFDASSLRFDFFSRGIMKSRMKVPRGAALMLPPTNAGHTKSLMRPVRISTTTVHSNSAVKRHWLNAPRLSMEVLMNVKYGPTSRFAATSFAKHGQLVCAGDVQAQ